MIITRKLGLLLVGSFALLSGCSLRAPDQPSKLHVTLDLSSSLPVSAAHLTQSSQLNTGITPGITTLNPPTDWSLFTCLAVNVVADGIASAQPLPQASTYLTSMIQGGFCSYLGITSSPVQIGSGVTSIDLSIPTRITSGLVQILGVFDPKGLFCNSQPSPPPLGSTYPMTSSNDGSAILFELGRAPVVLGGDTQAVITDSYSGLTTLADRLARRADCENSLGKLLSSLSYGSSSNTYPLNTQISENIPSVAGDAPTGYSISPALPAGLSFSSATGRITGSPTALSGSRSYVVTATNPYGSARTTLTIAVISRDASLASLGISNGTLSPTFATNSFGPYLNTLACGAVSVNLTPSVSQPNASVAVTVSSTPVLPNAGVYTINLSTNTPTPVSVTVTAQDGITTHTYSLNIGCAPNALNYSPGSLNAAHGIAFNSPSPSVTGTSPITWAISPTLPTGLGFDAATGVISGTATQDSSSAPYTVSASNLYGSATFQLTLGVLSSSTSDFTGQSFSGTHLGTAWSSTHSSLGIQPAPELDQPWAQSFGTLVGYWKLNQPVASAAQLTDGASVLATVGTNGIASVHSSPPGMSYVPGQVKQGLYLGGGNDGIQAALTTSISDGAFTATAWFKTTSTGDVKILCNGPSVSICQLGVMGGYVRVCLRNCPAGTTPVADGHWHFVGVIGTSNSVSAYLDGSTAPEVTDQPRNGTPSSGPGVFVGSAGSGGGFPGTLDEVAVWSTSLAVSDLTAIYNQQKFSYPTQYSELDSSWTPRWADLVSYYPLNGNPGPLTDNESVPNARASAAPGTATLAGGGSLTYVPGKLREGISFPGGTNDYLTIPRTIQDDFTIAFWMKTTANTSSCSGYTFYDSPDGMGLINAEVPGGAKDFGTELCNGRVVFGNGDPVTQAGGTGADTFVVSTVAVDDGSWHHVTATRDASSGTLKLYIDGVYNNTVTGAGTQSLTDPAAIRVGGFLTDVPGYYSGSLDDLALWTVALNAGEVQTLYAHQSPRYAAQYTSRVFHDASTSLWTSLGWRTPLPFGKGLADLGMSERSTSYSAMIDVNTNSGTSHDLMDGIVGLWHLDEPASTSGAASVKDRSGNGNDGTPSSVTFGVPGRLGSAAQFNASSISIADSPAQDAFPVTISAWAKFPPGAPGNSGIFNKYLSSSNNGYQLFLNSAGNGFDGWYFRDSNNYVFNGSDGAFSAPGYDDGQWHLAVMVVDASGGKMYVDGELKNSRAWTGTAGAPTTTAPISVGTYNGGGSFKGQLDEIALWSRALSAAEILALYRRGANRIQFQIRSCSTGVCDDSTEPWLGPNVSAPGYFSELLNVSEVTGQNPISSILAGSPLMTFSRFGGLTPNQPYFQYRAILQSDDTGTGCDGSWCSPELQSVTITP